MRQKTEMSDSISKILVHVLQMIDIFFHTKSIIPLNFHVIFKYLDHFLDILRN